jgi:hypothetical protein
MEELARQVRNDLLRTLVWAVIAIGVAAAAYQLLW